MYQRAIAALLVCARPDARDEEAAVRALIHRLLPAAWRRGRKAARRDGVRVVPGPGGPRRARASFVAVEEEPGLAG